MKESFIFDIRFSSAHFYHQPRWSEKKNSEEFGKCYNPYGHGHNYLWRIELLPPANTSTGRQWALTARKQLESIAEKLDHRHLNHEILEFKNKVPTTENISLWLRDEIKKSPLSSCFREFHLFELEDLWTTVPNSFDSLS
jgi:6-pyruvoyltetrahydropterin/6-carboxytetrahydropterin synthase